MHPILSVILWVFTIFVLVFGLVWFLHRHGVPSFQDEKTKDGK